MFPMPLKVTTGGASHSKYVHIDSIYWVRASFQPTDWTNTECPRWHRAGQSDWVASHCKCTQVERHHQQVVNTVANPTFRLALFRNLVIFCLSSWKFQGCRFFSGLCMTCWLFNMWSVTKSLFFATIILSCDGQKPGFASKTSYFAISQVSQV